MFTVEWDAGVLVTVDADEDTFNQQGVVVILVIDISPFWITPNVII